MLKPNYLSDCAGAYSELYSQLENDICADIARRYAKFGRKRMDASLWQIQKLREMQSAYSAYADMVKRTDRKAARILRKNIVDGCAEALKVDDAIYRMAGKAPASVDSSLALQEVIMAGISKTNGLMQNLTMTTANTASGAFERGLDRAYMQVISGAYDPDTALRRLINDLGSNGYQKIVYPSGHKDHLDVAARRALLTGLNQTTAEVQLARAKEMESDLVEVTSHAGARPSHQEWQGQIYSVSGKSGKYKSFYDETGYGTGEGLCGWNCYHNFYPYFEGISTPTFTDTYASKVHKTDQQMYDESQQQREFERKVRECRRKCVTLNAAMEEADGELLERLKADFAATSVRLKERENDLKKFCRKTKRTRYADRLMVFGFNQSVSQKATWANRKTVNG